MIWFLTSMRNLNRLIQIVKYHDHSISLPHWTFKCGLKQPQILNFHIFGDLICLKSIIFQKAKNVWFLNIIRLVLDACCPCRWLFLTICNIWTFSEFEIPDFVLNIRKWLYLVTQVKNQEFINWLKRVPLFIFLGQIFDSEEIAK